MRSEKSQRNDNRPLRLDGDKQQPNKPLRTGRDRPPKQEG